MVNPSTLEALLTEHDVARILGISVSTLRRWRLSDVGPKCLKCGILARYRPEDLSAWIESRPARGGGSASPPAAAEVEGAA